MYKKNRGLTIIGAGGHAKVVLDALQSAGESISAICLPEAPSSLLPYFEAYTLITDNALLGSVCYRDSSPSLVNGIGFTPAEDLHFKVIRKFEAKHFRFARVRHISSVISDSAITGEGSQIMASAVMQPGSKLGDHSILNTGAKIDHDTWVGAFSHVAPGATICGDCKIGDRVFIGAGSVIGPGVTVGDGSVIGALSLVLNDVAAYSRVLGKA